FQPAEAAVTGWDEAPNPTTHASFGDNGLTASVSAYGELMQFARYLGAGRSGVFSLDYYWTPEPSEIQARAEALQSRCTDQDGLRYGTQFEGLSPPQPPALRFVHNRWPRYEYDAGNFNMAIQYIVHDETLLHQVSIKNSSSAPEDVTFTFSNELEH